MLQKVRKGLPAIVALVVCLLALTACGGSNKDSKEAVESKYTGTWEATAATASGVEMDIDSIFSEFSMKLKKSGKAVVTISDQEVSGEWTETETGVLLSNTGLSDNVEEDSLEMTEKDEKLVLPYSGMEVTFEKIS